MTISPANLCRLRRFNNTTGAFGYISKRGRTGANLHPDRCTCQTSHPGDITTPHKHYDEGPEENPTNVGCARCTECREYTPAIEQCQSVYVGSETGNHPLPCERKPDHGKYHRGIRTWSGGRVIEWRDDGSLFSTGPVRN